MRTSEELIEKAELVYQLQGRWMNRVAAEVSLCFSSTVTSTPMRVSR